MESEPELAPEYLAIALAPVDDATQIPLPVFVETFPDSGRQPGSPRRGDPVEAWIKTWRDKFTDTWGDSAYWSIDAMLDDYRLHADTGVPLESEVSY